MYVARGLCGVSMVSIDGEDGGVNVSGENLTYEFRGGFA